jgi:hypothetical protein
VSPALRTIGRDFRVQTERGLGPCRVRAGKADRASYCVLSLPVCVVLCLLVAVLACTTVWAADEKTGQSPTHPLHCSERVSARERNSSNCPGGCQPRGEYLDGRAISSAAHLGCIAAGSPSLPLSFRMLTWPALRWCSLFCACSRRRHRYRSRYHLLMRRCLQGRTRADHRKRQSHTQTSARETLMEFVF